VTEDIEIQLCIHIKFSRARPRFHIGSMLLQLFGHLVNYVRTQHRNTNLWPLEQDSVSAVKRTSSLLDFSDNEIRTDFELVFSYLNFKREMRGHCQQSLTATPDSLSSPPHQVASHHARSSLHGSSSHQMHSQSSFQAQSTLLSALLP